MVHAHVGGQYLRLLESHILLVIGVDILIAAHDLFPPLIEIKERVGGAPFEFRLPLLLHLMLLLPTQMLQVLHLLVPRQIPRQQLQMHLVLLRRVVDIKALVGHLHFFGFLLLDIVVIHLDSSGDIIDSIIQLYILHLLLFALLDLPSQFR